ncbi:hypothetical protein TWF730_010237 [Orbilia blumenaviensis]|uniref:OTU domain-containing protein n=1 Tax=Orbilia blumenaviensis TaxID=1796055 RepID=A0AAV9UNW7_9PEZI
MSSEFPLLEGQGLYASDIIGDGDCLFRSFSDQLYGHQERATTIRLRTTSYMRRHSSYFKLFLSVPPPARKTRSSSALTLPNEDTIDRVFLDHVKRMEKPGVYGDNLEIVAFARCYGVDVKIYQREFAYLVSGERDVGENDDDDDGEDSGDGGSSMLGKEEHLRPGQARRVLHIAYHDWEHYSSVRNIDGPHKGLPKVSPKPLTEEGKKKQQEIIEQGVVIMPWMEDVVERSLPGAVSKQKIREVLERCKGDVNLAVSKLLDEAEGEAENGDAAGDKVGLEEDLELDIGESSSQRAADQKKKKTPQKRDPPPGKQVPKAGNKPMRETGRERKERQQKEKVEKKKAKAGGGSGASKDKNKDLKGSTASQSASASNDGIKTLHV